MKKFTIGSDVEFFIHDGKKFVSAIPFIGDDVDGTKHNPIVFGDGATLQRDNVAAEFATAVAKDKVGFVLVMSKAMKHLVDTMDAHKLTVKATPSVVFDQKQLNHWEALEFGCDPDFNAWEGGQVNCKPCAINKTLRTAALHVHVGSPLLKSKKSKQRFIRLMDCVHGIVSTMMDTSPESLARKELYGKAGAYRPTKYGVEYRVMSNYFASSPRFVKIIYDLTKDALTIFERDDDDKLVHELGGKAEVCGIINSGNSSLAQLSFMRIVSGFIDVETSNYIMDNKNYKPKSLKEEWNV